MLQTTPRFHRLALPAVAAIALVASGCGGSNGGSGGGGGIGGGGANDKDAARDGVLKLGLLSTLDGPFAALGQAANDDLGPGGSTSLYGQSGPGHMPGVCTLPCPGPRSSPSEVGGRLLDPARSTAAAAVSDSSGKRHRERTPPYPADAPPPADHTHNQRRAQGGCVRVLLGTVVMPMQQICAGPVAARRHLTHPHL